MRALVLADGRLRFDPRHPERNGAPGETRVDVTLAGVCATDLELARGYMGFAGVPGHEFVGVAREGPYAGRRVVGEINAACGRCERCARGMDRHCATRTVLGILGRDGAFAERLYLPQRNLSLVPDEMPDDVAVFVEPVAAALALGEAADVAPGARAAVVGDGKLGLLCAQALALSGARVTLLGRHERKLEIARRAGADARREVDAGATFPLVVDATGSSDGFARALALVEPRGTVVLKTTTRDAPKESLAKIVIDEIRVVGSRCGRFAPAIEALRAGRIDPRPLVDARLPLERGTEAFAKAGERGALKVLLQVSAA